MAREKGGVSSKRIKTDAAFQRTRENMAEFGRAGKAGKLLRSSFRSLLQRTADSRMIARMTKEMMRVVKSDTVNGRGLRKVTDGELALLEGFEFNSNSQLGTTLFAPYSSAINRATGELLISIASFIPATMIAAPAGATHFKIVSAGTAVNFETEVYEAEISASGILPLDTVATAALSLASHVTAGSVLPLFLALGIEFYQEVNGTPYPLKNGAFNALALAKVSGA